MVKFQRDNTVRKIDPTAIMFPSDQSAIRPERGKQIALENEYQ